MAGCGRRLDGDARPVAVCAGARYGAESGDSFISSHCHRALRAMDLGHDIHTDARQVMFESRPVASSWSHALLVAFGEWSIVEIWGQDLLRRRHPGQSINVDGRGWWARSQDYGRR